MQIIQTQKNQNANVNKPLVARLKLAMMKKGLNPKTLAEKANVGRSFVYDILNGKSGNPTSSKLAAISEQLGVSVQYLLTGMHISTSSDLNTNIAEVPILTVESTAEGNIVVTPADKGETHYFENNWIKESLNSSPNSLRTIKIVGDSMQPTFFAGDVLLVDTSRKAPTPPGIFVLFDGLGLHAKRLELKGKDAVSVISDNNQYLTYEMKMEELNIVGRVVWLGRQLK